MTVFDQFSVGQILVVSVAIAATLIYLPYLVVAYGRFKVGYDMSAPRSTFDQLPDYAKRATWAHTNSFESFMIYTAAAGMAYVTQVDSRSAVTAVVAYLIARSLFSVFYILDVPVGRSLSFGVGSASMVTLMALSIMQVFH
jgi:uncharacterized MAPEG superfamily protein